MSLAASVAFIYFRVEEIVSFLQNIVDTIKVCAHIRAISVRNASSIYEFSDDYNACIR